MNKEQLEQKVKDLGPRAVIGTEMIMATLSGLLGLTLLEATDLLLYNVLIMQEALEERQCAGRN